jgi:hypothetical protein
MKVSGPNGVGSASAPRSVGRPASGGFSIAASTGAAETAAAGRLAGVSGVSSIDALLALQEVGGPLERRRKAVRRAGKILDVLDEVKVALLEGGVSPAALDRLMAAVRQERPGADDPRLEALLNEIETRAVVELTKLEMSRSAA